MVDHERKEEMRKTHEENHKIFKKLKELESKQERQPIPPQQVEVNTEDRIKRREVERMLTEAEKAREISRRLEALKKSVERLTTLTELYEHEGKRLNVRTRESDLEKKHEELENLVYKMVKDIHVKIDEAVHRKEENKLQQRKEPDKQGDEDEDGRLAMLFRELQEQTIKTIESHLEEWLKISLEQKRLKDEGLLQEVFGLQKNLIEVERRRKEEGKKNPETRSETKCGTLESKGSPKQTNGRVHSPHNSIVPTIGTTMPYTCQYKSDEQTGSHKSAQRRKQS